MPTDLFMLKSVTLILHEVFGAAGHNRTSIAWAPRLDFVAVYSMHAGLFCALAAV